MEYAPSTVTPEVANELLKIVRRVQAGFVPYHVRDEARGAGMEAAWKEWAKSGKYSFVGLAVRNGTVDFLRIWNRGTQRKKPEDRARVVPIMQEDGSERAGLPATHDEFEEIETKMTVESALVKLTARELEVYREYVVEGQTMAAAGEALGITEAAICKAFTKICSKLEVAVRESMDA